MDIRRSAIVFPNLRWGRVLTMSIFAALGTGHAMADWHSFMHKIQVGYHRNRAWPEPFNEVDAMQVVAPFEIMKQNGWRAHNTLGSELFRSGDGVLLAAGRNRVEWIATQAPGARRVVYVLRGSSRDETEARVASVRKAISGLYMEQAPPQVLVTSVKPASAPGPWVTKINRDALEQMPAPRLPSQSAAGTDGINDGGGAE